MKKTTTKKTAKKKYEVSLRLGDKVYSTSSDSITEAISSIRPTKISLKGLFTVSNGVSKFEEMMFPAQVRRILFGSDMVRSMFEKKALITLKNV